MKKKQIDPLKGTPFVRVITRKDGDLPRFRCEKDFQKAVVKLFAYWGWRIAVFNETGRRTWRHNIGWPDMIVVKESRIYGFELKYKNNTRTPEQTVWGHVLSTAGVPTQAVWPQQWQKLERLARGEE